MIEFGKTLRVEATRIAGLLVIDLPVHADDRGWFKENWQRDKMVDAGLPDFGPVQNNVSFNDSVGTTRGVHAEPWDKYVSVAAGRVFGAWIDLREGAGFGTTFTAELDPSRAVFVPRGVGNAYQTTEPNTVYNYLVNGFYDADASYTSINLGDEAAGIAWPVPLNHASMSAKDRANPSMAQVEPIAPPKILILGSTGQVGRALCSVFADRTQIEFATRESFDLRSGDLDNARAWSDYSTIINAAAYTAVDFAETAKGRQLAWATNVASVATLARIAARHSLTLVHLSSDYVFDGSAKRPYREDDLFSPLGVYGQTKAAADSVVATVPRHYIVRTSWVIGEGRNFIRTMHSLASSGAEPLVVNDQRGRLTFASEIARAIIFLLDSEAPFGTYNVSSRGAPASWADIALKVFRLAGRNPRAVESVSTEEYSSSVCHPIASRPLNSVLDLRKIESIGFIPADGDEMLELYVKHLLLSERLRNMAEAQSD
jgi:dTDP-4-dehydrorhamnose 3,5-epimerase